MEEKQILKAPLFSHQAISGLGEFGLDLSDEPAVLGQAEQEIDASRAKPESARSKMRTFGQRWRMRATIRAISSTNRTETSVA